MKANPKNSDSIKWSQKVVLVEVTTDSKSTFKEFTDYLSRSTSYKIIAMDNIRKSFTLVKAKLFYSVFLNGQSNCALVPANISTSDQRCFKVVNQR